MLDPLVAVGVDQLVLGCTHYPFLSPVIQRVVGQEITLIDPAPAVARQTSRVLSEQMLASPTGSSAHHTFFTTGDAASFAQLLGRLTAIELPFVAGISLSEHLQNDRVLTFWTLDSVN